jgi:hypothetical protein
LCFQPGEKSGNEGGWDRAGRDQLPANEVDPQVEPLEPVCPEKYHVTGFREHHRRGGRSVGDVEHREPGASAAMLMVVRKIPMSSIIRLLRVS